LGEDVWVVLTGLDEIKEFSMMDETVARPNMENLAEMYSFGTSLGRTSSNADRSPELIELC
jgi:hypothetical protein